MENRDKIMSMVLKEFSIFPSLGLQHTMKPIKMRRLRKNRDGGRRRVGAGEVEMENLKLYLENRSIIEENERLRRAAMRLRRENGALLFHLLANRETAADSAAGEPAADKAPASFL